MGIWENSDISSSDEEEEEKGIANLCLITNNDEVYFENSFNFF